MAGGISWKKLILITLSKLDTLLKTVSKHSCISQFIIVTTVNQPVNKLPFSGEGTSPPTDAGPAKKSWSKK